jgi:hypothetical protein
MARDSRPTNTPWTTGRIEDAVAATQDATDITGGRIVTLIAGGSLKLGDVVCLGSNRTLTTSTVAATHKKAFGIVVGGRQTQYNVIGDKAQYGVLVAALTGEEVIVCISGICYVVADGAIGAGVSIAPSTTTLGKVRAVTDLTVDAVATPVTSSAANGAILSGDGLQSCAIVGKLIESAAADGDVRAALITIR